MTRIFFVNGENDLRSADVQKIVRIQGQIGVDGYTAGMRHTPVHLRRFFLVDDAARIAREPFRGPDHCIEGIDLTSSTEKTQMYLRLFNELKNLDGTRLYSESYLGLDPHTSDLTMSTPQIDANAFRIFEHLGWQNSAEHYHKHFATLTSQTVGHVLDSVLTNSTGSLLDVATGPGYVVEAALRRGVKKVTGVDFSDVMLSKARARFAHEPNADFQEHDAEMLAFPDKSFDAVTMNFGILHFSKPDRALAEAFRVLRPTGRFAFTTWSRPEEARGFAIVLRAIEAFGNARVPLPEGPPFFYFSDPDNSIRSLRSTGFSDPLARKIELTWHLASAEDLFDAFFKGTARVGGLLKAQSQSAINAIKHSVVTAAKEYKSNGGIELPMAAVVVSAARPADPE